MAASRPVVPLSTVSIETLPSPTEIELEGMNTSSGAGAWWGVGAAGAPKFIRPSAR